MKLLALAVLTFSFSAWAQPEPITSDFQILNPIVNYKLHTSLANRIGEVQKGNQYTVTLPGLIECTRTLRPKDTHYACSLLKGGWKTHKEVTLSGRGELELTSWEKDGKRLYEALSGPTKDETHHGVGEDFVTHDISTKSSSSCSGYDPIVLTGLYSYRVRVSKDGEYWYDSHNAYVRVMMDRPVYECP